MRSRNMAGRAAPRVYFSGFMSLYCRKRRTNSCCRWGKPQRNEHPCDALVFLGFALRLRTCCVNQRDALVESAQLAFQSRERDISVE